MPQALSSSPKLQSGLKLLGAWIESQVAYRQVPGLSIALVHDQEVIWKAGFGLADIASSRTAQPDTIYRIASISKLFTSTAIMQLRDRGQLSLDDPVVNYLPWFKIQSRFQDIRPITIRHLLTHTSGLPRESAFPYWTDFQFPTREQIIESLPRQELSFPPETQWKYSNLGLTIAGEIVVAITGVDFEQYIQKQILDPLEMKDTSVNLPENHRSRLASSYGRRMPDGSRKQRPFTDSRGLTPAANLSSTVEDMARFASLQFSSGPAGGPQILKGETLKEMHRVHWLKPDWTTAWGLGFSVERKEGRNLVGHGGNVAGYATKITFCPEEKFAAIVMTNTDDGNPDMYRDRAFTLIAPIVKELTTVSAESKHPDPNWERYVGLYRDDWADCQIAILNGELCLFDPTESDPTSCLSKLIPEGENTFRMAGEAGFSDIGELVVFELDNEGKVKQVKIGENYMWPIR